MTDEKTKIYPSSVIALPESKNVQVQALNENQETVEGSKGVSAPKKLDKNKVVRKIIQHLESTEQ